MLNFVKQNEKFREVNDVRVHDCGSRLARGDEFVQLLQPLGAEQRRLSKIHLNCQPDLTKMLFLRPVARALEGDHSGAIRFWCTPVRKAHHVDPPYEVE